jgi:hypothetical protein
MRQAMNGIDRPHAVRLTYISHSPACNSRPQNFRQTGHLTKDLLSGYSLKSNFKTPDREVDEHVHNRPLIDSRRPAAT